MTIDTEVQNILANAVINNKAARVRLFCEVFQVIRGLPALTQEQWEQVVAAERAAEPVNGISDETRFEIVSKIEHLIPALALIGNCP